MYWVIGRPTAMLMASLTSWLEAMGTGNLVVLGLILGAMIASDMGGPINKVAFSFGSAMVGTVDPSTGLPSATAVAIMAGIGAAICIPPLAMGLATIVAPKNSQLKNAIQEKLLLSWAWLVFQKARFLLQQPIRYVVSQPISLEVRLVQQLPLV